MSEEQNDQRTTEDMRHIDGAFQSGALPMMSRATATCEWQSLPQIMQCIRSSNLWHPTSENEATCRKPHRTELDILCGKAGNGCGPRGNEPKGCVASGAVPEATCAFHASVSCGAVFHSLVCPLLLVRQSPSHSSSKPTLVTLQMGAAERRLRGIHSRGSQHGLVPEVCIFVERLWPVSNEEGR